MILILNKRGPKRALILNLYKLQTIRVTLLCVLTTISNHFASLKSNPISFLFLKTLSTSGVYFPLLGLTTH